MYNLLKLNLARNSLRYIIRTYDIKLLYIPYYLCNVIRLTLKKENCKPIFYHIDDTFYPMSDFPKSAYILYPNYFGICDKNVKVLTDKYPNLIVDNAHSFYSKPSGLACFNSARKFMPVYNGSYLWIQKMSFIPPEEEYHNAAESENEFLKNENAFSNFDIKILNNNIEHDIEVKNNLNENRIAFKKYNTLLAKTNQLYIDLDSSYSPFGYPYLANTNKEADELVEKLFAQSLTIYRYWGELPKNYPEYKFYRRLVCIPFR